jgi:hypothetical protein
VLTGAIAIVAVALLVAVIDPATSVAVTAQVIVLLKSAVTKVYVLLVAPLILDPARFH